jgi:hypothetical protein
MSAADVATGRPVSPLAVVTKMVVMCSAFSVANLFGSVNA